MAPLNLHIAIRCFGATSKCGLDDLCQKAGMRLKSMSVRNLSSVRRVGPIDNDGTVCRIEMNTAASADC